MIVDVRCPYCYTILELKRENHISIPYCKNCETYYKVTIDSINNQVIINELKDK